MAKVQRNVVIQGISGAIGALVFRHMPDGSTYVSGKPDFSRRKFSQEQKNHQSRFRAAAAFAREAARRHPIYAELAKGTGKSPYNFALSDWFNPPVIHAIERKGNVIRVQASDEVMVAKVEVMIVDEAGQVLEKGKASQVDKDVWEFVVEGDEWNVEGYRLKVVAKAWDLAGNGVEGEGD